MQASRQFAVEQALVDRRQLVMQVSGHR
jgi:hypothetical protein